MKKSMFMSISMHLLIILISLTFTTKTNKDLDPKVKGSNYNVEVVDVPMDEDVDIIEKEAKDPYQRDASKKECASIYGGIGIEINLKTNAVTLVSSGYPADTAGILVGDIVTTISGEDIRGEIGSLVALSVVRGNKQFILNLIRDKICYNKT